MSHQPEDPTDKTVLRRRTAPPPADDPLGHTQVHRPSSPPPTNPRPPGAPPPPPGRPPTAPPGGPQPSKRRRLRPDQIKYLIVAWFGLSIIIGVCAFAGIYAFSTGAGSRLIDATPIGQVSLETATSLPTATPESATNIPTLIPTNPVAGAPTPETGGGALPPIETFNLGGQSVHGGFPGAESMKAAGMTWVKLQAFDLTVDFGPAIENAHNLGFRILISVVDKANKDLVTTPEFQETYAQYLENVAAQGADAIEVWNEMNIDREWPSGQISGAAYAELLANVYPRIKAVNPDTIVISGAPSPTGFFGGGCSGQGCDDRPYLRAMVQAGALNYTDCVGIHYNEGVVPPTQTGGDPRGNPNHYTRYYQTMVDTYLEATGNLRPLCFTEIGYLTDDGYDPLAQVAPSFSWAGDNTVAEQAEWLAEAASMSRESGDILLFIVFNVDFTTYGADPQAGYAIIRPDVTCPACESLAEVMSQ